MKEIASLLLLLSLASCSNYEDSKLDTSLPKDNLIVPPCLNQ